MFKNRTFQVKLLDRKVDPNPDVVPAQPINVADTVGVVALGTMAVIATYMAADTLRQTIIYTVCVKGK